MLRACQVQVEVGGESDFSRSRSVVACQMISGLGRFEKADLPWRRTEAEKSSPQVFFSATGTRVMRIAYGEARVV